MNDQPTATTNTDREVAVREIFKDVLSHLTYATTCFEIASGMFATPVGRRDSEDAEVLRQLRAAENRGRGAYRDIFLAAEWRHDREVATSAVCNVLAKAGVTASPDVAEELVEAVLSSMPGSAGWEAGGENYWSGDALGGVK